MPISASLISPVGLPALSNKPDLAARILQIQRDKLSPDERHGLQHVGLLGHQFLPAFAGRLRDVGGHDAVSGSVEVGAQEERIAVVADEIVLRVEARDPRHDLRVGFAQIENRKLILALGAAPHADHEKVAVVGDLAVESPFLFVGRS